MKEFFEYFFGNIAKAFSSPSYVIGSVIDILSIFLIVYAMITFLRRNNAFRFVKVLAFFTVGCLLAMRFAAFLPATGKLAGYFVIVIVLALFTLYTDDTKRVIRKLYSPKDAQSAYNVKYDCSDVELRKAIADIVKAVQNMSKKNTGALIIVAPETIPESIIESGTKLNADLSCQLLEGLFFVRAPLHDGAVFIRGNKILAAGCFLPLTQNTNLDKDLGTRHRAAIGETEQYPNHLAIIVSEETGVISVARNGEITRYYDSTMLTDALEQVYGLKGRQ